VMAPDDPVAASPVPEPVDVQYANAALAHASRATVVMATFHFRDTSYPLLGPC